MIKGSELRIGNWVYYENKPIQIKATNTCGVLEMLETSHLFLGRDVYEYLYPIPLSPMVLKFFGFKKIDNDFYRIKTKKMGVGLEVCLKEKRTILFKQGRGCFANNLSELKFTKHLHHLQNLYFGLTLEELEANNQWHTSNK